MKLLILLGLHVSGFRLPLGDASYQKQKDLDKFRLPLSRYGNAIRRELPRSDDNPVYSPNGRFEFTIGSYEDPGLVSRLETALQVASGFLENAIDFKGPIRVNVEHGTYCARRGTCERKDYILGTCGPNVHEIVGPYGDTIWYPYSLVKQGGFGAEPKRTSRFDMEMYLKSSDRLVYPDQYGIRKPGMGSDLVETIIHELSHGLGIISGIRVNYTTHFGPSYSFGYYSNGVIDVKFLKHKFDTHLYYNHQSVHRLIRSMDFRGQGINRFISNFKNMNQVHQYWDTAPIGNLMIEVLETLGYTRNPRPLRSKSQLALYETMRSHNCKSNDFETQFYCRRYKN